MPLATCVGNGTEGVCDMGIYFPPCCPHARSGTNGQGSDLFEIGGQAVHLVSHTGPTNCPHGGTFESTGGSSLIEVEGLPVTLVGHTTICKGCGKTGTHIEGNDLLDVEY